MGYLAGGVCYDELMDAAQAQAWASGHDSVIDIGGYPHILQFFPDGGGVGATTYLLRQVLTKMPEGTEVYSAQLQYVPPPCGPFNLTQLDAAGGAQIALAIGAVWVVGWAIRMLIRTLNSGDGNPSTSE